MSDNTQHEALLAAYPLKTEADALFFKSPHLKPSFRFEVPELGYEFSDGFWIGSEIKGVLYYKEGVFGGILPPDGATKADFYVDQRGDVGALYVHIKFFAPGSQDEVIGEFLARDSHDASGSSGLLRERLEGDWNKVNYVVGPATAFKVADSTQISISSVDLGKKAEFECKPTDSLYPVAIDTKGRLTVKDIKTIDRSNSARWYHDYVVFYEGHHAKEFTAFYFPEDTSIVHDDNVLFHNVTWTNT